MGTQELSRRMRRRAVWGLAAVAAASAALASAGCGSGDDASSASGASGASAAAKGDGGSSSAYVAQAEKLSADARRGLVYSPSDEFTPASELKTMTRWLGPSSAPPVPRGKSIAFVSCGAVICNETVRAGAKIAQGLGFKTHLVNINGKADIQNINQAMSSALALRPSAIVGMCVTATQVADKLDQARKDGVVTVSTCDPTPTGGPGQFAAAADYANGLSTELLGWGIVADSDGRADVVAIKDEGYPAVIRKIGNLVKVLQGCATCKVKTTTWQVTDAADSAKAANIISGIINGNPKMDTLVMPYSVGMPSAIQAVQSSGRKIRIYADDLDAVNQQALKSGALAMVSSVDPQLAMYQAIDQVIRGLSRQPFVEPARLPYLAHLYTKDTVPDTGVGAFVPLFDYPSVYRKLWKQP